jgi:hypothetical protein
VAGDAAAGPASSARQGTAFTRRVLEKLELIEMEAGLTWPLYACLRALERDWSLSYLMGVTGIAFQFTVDERIGDQGPTDVMDWTSWFDRLHRLGFDATVFNAQLKSFSSSVKTNTETEFQACQATAWDAVRASLDRGVPAIAWMPITPAQKERGEGCEYALLVGYDSEKGLYDVRVPGRAMWSIPWDGFGRADPVNWFNVIVFGERRPVEERELEREALQFAVAHARSTQPGHGMDAYATWQRALEEGRLAPDANPRAARIVREAREHAAAFVREIAGRHGDIAADLAEAQRRYRQVTRAWDAYVHELLHTPGGDGDRKQAALRLVETAAAAEAAAVAALEKGMDKEMTAQS